MFGLATWKLAAAGIAAALLIGVVAMFIHAQREIGRQAEIAIINRQNQEARDAALSGIRDVDACYAAGGMWSVRDGKCGRP